MRRLVADNNRAALAPTTLTMSLMRGALLGWTKKKKEKKKEKQAALSYVRE
jgi:hypothetical protein